MAGAAAVILLGLALGFGFAGFILDFTRTGTCDGEAVCERVRALEAQAVNLDLVLVANADQATITLDASAAGDAVTPTSADFRVLCANSTAVVLARATPADGVSLTGDSAYLWFGAVDMNGPVLTPFPADGLLHAVTGAFPGYGNIPTAIFAETTDGRQRAQLEGFVYVENC